MCFSLSWGTPSFFCSSHHENEYLRICLYENVFNLPLFNCVWNFKSEIIFSQIRKTLFHSFLCSFQCLIKKSRTILTLSPLCVICFFISLCMIWNFLMRCLLMGLFSSIMLGSWWAYFKSHVVQFWEIFLNCSFDYFVTSFVSSFWNPYNSDVRPQTDPLIFSPISFSLTFCSTFFNLAFNPYIELLYF